MEKDKSFDPNGGFSSQPQLFSVGNVSLPMKPHKTVRIAVSGDVLLNKLETEIIDTREFQRLRSIKQLGTVNYVYPTAVHTRFDHSLGTLGMACDMMRCIRENRHNLDDERMISPEEEQLVQLLALLHDVTHIPFGHTLEDECCLFERHDHDSERVQRFLGPDSSIGKLILKSLGKDLFDRFFALVTADKKHLEKLGDDVWVYDLVNNTVCADLLDYLRRDSFFCDIDLQMNYRFLKFLYLRRDSIGRRVVVRLWKEGKPTPRQDVISELIRLLDNRYLLGERVYFHHTKIKTSAMIAGAVQRAIKTKALRLEQLYELGDETLLYKLASANNRHVAGLAKALQDRRLWYQVHERTRDEVEADHKNQRDIDLWEVIMKDWWKDSDNRLAHEEEVASFLGLESGDVLFHCPDHRMAMKPADMKVFWNGTLKSLKECLDDNMVSDKLRAILTSHEKLWQLRTFLNPAKSEREEKVKNAAEYLFTFQIPMKDRRGKSFFRDVVEGIAETEKLVDGMLQAEFSEKVDLSVQRLMTQTATIRDRRVVVGIVKDVFSRPTENH